MAGYTVGPRIDLRRKERLARHRVASAGSVLTAAFNIAGRRCPWLWPFCTNGRGLIVALRSDLHTSMTQARNYVPSSIDSVPLKARSQPPDAVRRAAGRETMRPV